MVWCADGATIVKRTRTTSVLIGILFLVIRAHCFFQNFSCWSYMYLFPHGCNWTMFVRCYGDSACNSQDRG